MRHKPSLRRLYLTANLDLEAASGVPGARWEPFQIAHLDDEGTFRIENKSRQIAWSWLIAAESMADAILTGRSSLYVSINRNEAQEKIRYARQVYESLNVERPRIVGESQTHIELENGARLLSLPSRPPRGKARHNVYLDEFAHLQQPRAVYTAALPIISKGGRLRIGSTPFGPQGMFWEIYTEQVQPYPGYRRAFTPWWMVQSMCIDIPRARQVAPGMSQNERVAMFGTERLKIIHGNMLSDDFAQEYEGNFADSGNAWITFAEWSNVQSADLLSEQQSVQGNAINAALDLIDRLRQLSLDTHIENAMTVGMDVGRTHDASEIFVCGMGTTSVIPVRANITMRKSPFDAQLAVVRKLLDALPVVRMLIDKSGLGMQLAEQLETYYPGKVVGVDFNNANKAMWAVDARMLVQKRQIVVPVDRALAYQVASVKRIQSGSSVIFDADRTNEHHADKFWAWALAVHAASQIMGGGNTVRIIGKRRVTG